MHVLKSNHKDIDFISQFMSTNLLNLEDIYIIQVEGFNVGIIEYRTNEESIYIDFIGIQEEYQGNHYATDAIHYLLNQYPNHELFGNCAPNEAAYWFWDSLGADFYMEYDFEDYMYNGECIPFTLH